MQRPLGNGRSSGRFADRLLGRVLGRFGKVGNRRIRSSASRPEPALVPREPRAWGRALLCVGLAALVGGGGYGLRLALLRSDRFALTEMRVSPLRHVEPALVIARSGLPLGKSLFALDLGEAERRIAREPWVKSVRVRRELPHAVAIDIVEREAHVVVAMGALYLVDDAGEVFKRARADEAVGLPVVTGLGRERYLADPARVRSVLQRALALDRLWREHGTRPVAGELHHEGGHDAAAAFTVYFMHAGQPVQVRLAAPDDTTSDRLGRLDAVLTALDREGAHAAVIHLDQRAQLERVAVRLAGNTNEDHGGVASGDAEAQTL